MMHFVVFLLLTTICKVLYSPLISRKLPQRHGSCLSLGQHTTFCSTLSPLSRHNIISYSMPNPDFNVKIMASDRRKCTNEPDVFCRFLLHPNMTEMYTFCGQKAYFEKWNNIFWILIFVILSALKLINVIWKSVPSYFVKNCMMEIFLYSA